MRVLKIGMRLIFLALFSGHALAQNITVIVPQFAVGDGWRTELAFINTGTQPADWGVTFTGSENKPVGFDLQFLDGQREYYRDNNLLKSKFPLAPNAIERMTMVPCANKAKPGCDQEGTQTGFARFTLPPTLKLQIGIHNIDADDDPLSSMAMAAVTPGQRFVMEVDALPTYVAGLAIALVSGDKARVKLILRDAAGKELGTEIIVFDQRVSRHQAIFVTQLFSWFRGVGTIEILFESGGGIDPNPAGAVAALRFDYAKGGGFRMSNLVAFIKP